MTNAQTEARAIARWVVLGCGVPATPEKVDPIAEVIATALAAKDAELERRDMQLEASAKVALDLSAQLAEARKALDPDFASTCREAEVAGLVERLTNERPTNMMAVLALHLESASLIQSQAARIAELEEEAEHYKEIGSLAVKFRFSDDVFVESRGPGVWVVTNGSSVLNNLGEWEYEPRPSSRTDEFIDRTRLAFSDAVIAARSLLNGETR